jgi:hypothetical protein
MQPYRLDIDPANVDDNGIAENQTTAGAASLSLNGALADLGTSGQFDIGDSYSSGINGVKIGISSAADIQTIVFTVTGKDENGNTVTEDITGVNANTVQSTTYWSQITDIASDVAVGSNVYVGTVDEIITRTLPVNWRAFEAATVAITGLSGTCQFDVDETFDDMRLGSDVNTNWIANLSNQSADVAGLLTLHATGVRLKFDSYTDGAELQFAVIQGGL